MSIQDLPGFLANYGLKVPGSEIQCPPMKGALILLLYGTVFLYVSWGMLMLRERFNHVFPRLLHRKVRSADKS